MLLYRDHHRAEEDRIKNEDIKRPQYLYWDPSSPYVLDQLVLLILLLDTVKSDRECEYHTHDYVLYI